MGFDFAEEAGPEHQAGADEHHMEVDGEEQSARDGAEDSDGSLSVLEDASLPVRSLTRAEV